MYTHIYIYMHLHVHIHMCVLLQVHAIPCKAAINTVAWHPTIYI